MMLRLYYSWFNKNINYFIQAVIGTVIAIYFFFPFSKDWYEYNKLFNNLSPTLGVFDYPTPEYLFWGWLQLNKIFNQNLLVALIPLIFISLFLKLKALRYFSNSFAYTCLGYVSAFYLLHECSQLRISIALAFALWACIAITERKHVKAILLCIVSAGFHITAPLLPVVYFLCFYYQLIRKIAWPSLALGVFTVIADFSLRELVLKSVLKVLGGHYLTYFYATKFAIQNTSGLFYPYAIGLSCLLLSLASWVKFNPKENTLLFSTCLSVCVFGKGILYWLHDTVAIASRLADVLTVLIVPLIATVIGKLSPIYQVLSVILLFAFFLARFAQLF